MMMVEDRLVPFMSGVIIVVQKSFDDMEWHDKGSQLFCAYDSCDHRHARKTCFVGGHEHHCPTRGS